MALHRGRVDLLEPHLARAIPACCDGSSPMKRSSRPSWVATTVVSQMNFWMNYGSGQPKEAPFANLLLDCGANPNARLAA
jgi:hypothetical protein